MNKSTVKVKSKSLKEKYLIPSMINKNKNVKTINELRTYPDQY